MRPVQGAISGRPNRPLVVRCGYDGSTRRVHFPSAMSCRLESLRTRIEECFSLSAWPFFLTYTDDDGEEYPIRTELDLTDAISYFVTGEDDRSSLYSGNGQGPSGSGGAYPGGVGYPAPKITMRLDVVVEYDGPSLSDTSSIASYRTSERSWDERSIRGDGESERDRDGGDTASLRSYRRRPRDSYASSFASGVSGMSGVTSLSGLGSDAEIPGLSDRLRGARLSIPESRSRSSSPISPEVSPADNSFLSPLASRLRPARRLLSPRSPVDSVSTATPLQRLLPTPPSSTSLATSDTAQPSYPSYASQGGEATGSDLASRWLREQSQLASRGPRLRRRHYSDSEGSASEDERVGDIALVRDARGRYYYSYQSEASSLFSRDEDNASLAPAPGALPASAFPHASTSARRFSPPETTAADGVGSASGSNGEPGGPPILAPDCSACGVRLEYLRYACMSCGECDRWAANAVGKAPFVPPRSGEDVETSSEGTASGERSNSNSSQSRSGGSQGSATVYGFAEHPYNNLRTRSESMSTNVSTHVNANGNGPDPFSPPDRLAAPRGYELCANCIEVHGIAHAKAMRRRQTGLRHTFREKIWGTEGWIDVDYADDIQCTICNTTLTHSRFKCVSCPKFDLCRTCYQKVEEIHPVHVFLSLPDKPLPQLEQQPTNGHEAEPTLVRHPGAFCHNCLQDIVGPRFHCAVCPSWDLCIQCEGVSAPGDGQHTADHIMMKIPIPLASAEVEAVSRRARDRWFQQDSARALAAPSSRSSSPTIDAETVYAPSRARVRSPVPGTHSTFSGTGIPASAGGHGAPGVSVLHPRAHSAGIHVRPHHPHPHARVEADPLDHNARCASCNLWIMGRRYQCANCPSDPPFNLCSICELRSYKVHDPRHVFFKFDRPVHVPLQSDRPLLPLLYKHKVGQVPPTAVLNPHDPAAYLKHVLHKDTLCDIHSDQIRGIWLRCAHCPAGFDICADAEAVAEHDPTHVFVVFKARVDMGAFRRAADLGSTPSKPLLQQTVYVS